MGVLEHHKLPVFDIKSVPSKNELIVSSEDGIVSIWDIVSLKLLFSFKVSPKTVRVISINPDERTVAFGCKDNNIRIYNLEDYSLIHIIDEHTNRVINCCLLALSVARDILLIVK